MSREGYREGADFFVEVTRLVPDEAWDAPGLGAWSVRSLVGHTSRALLIVEQFSRVAPVRVDIADSVEYYRRAFVGEGTNERIAERGRQTGKELGADPAGAVAELRDRVLARVDALPDDHALGTLIGGMRLVDYLPGRTMELVVHTLDIAEAIGVAIEPPRGALRDALHLLADLAVESGAGASFALAATGRGSGGAGFSVIG